MKRCNNCGWFNLDTAARCEKCDEESFEIAELNSGVPESESGIIPVLKEDANSIEQVPTVKSESVPAVAKSMMATVAFGADKPVVQPRKNLAATVMDASSLMTDDAPSQCPKCNYPITGYVEYCPNCGVTIKHQHIKSSMPVDVPVMEPERKPVKETLASTVMLNEPLSAMPHKSAVTVKENDLKATVRDLSAYMTNDEESSEVFMLVPMGGLGEAPIELKIGEVVMIAGRRYIFQK